MLEAGTLNVHGCPSAFDSKPGLITALGVGSVSPSVQEVTKVAEAVVTSLFVVLVVSDVVSDVVEVLDSVMTEVIVAVSVAVTYSVTIRVSPGESIVAVSDTMEVNV